jgi:hypothetical protein
VRYARPSLTLLALRNTQRGLGGCRYAVLVVSVRRLRLAFARMLCDMSVVMVHSMVTCSVLA